MNNPDIQSALQAALENEIHPDQIRLWPAVAQRLAARKRPLFNQGDASMKPSFLRTALIMVTVMAGLALLFATPQGQAFAQDLLKFFTRTPGNTIPATPKPEETRASIQWVDITTDLPPAMPTATNTPSPALAAFAADCGDFTSPTCSVESIRSKVNFSIKELGSIPADQYFMGATGGPDGVLILYTQDHRNGNPIFKSNSLSILEERWTGQLAQGSSEVAASAVIEKVQIGNLPGEYSRGGFYQLPKESVARWNPDLGVETLRWVDDGMIYTLKHSFSNGIDYGRKQLIALAESLTAQPVTKRTMPTATPDPETYAIAYPNFTLSITEARKQSGFNVRGPGRLPNFLLFGGAMVDVENKLVSILYLTDLEGRLQGNMTGLILSEQPAPNPNDCRLCSFFVGESHPAQLDRDARMLPPDAPLETVKIGAQTGQYVEGYWHHPDGCCFAYASFNTDMSHLRWWKDGIAFDLTAISVNISQADMITIAESIQ